MSGGYIANDEIALLSAATLTAAYTGNTTGSYENRSTSGVTLLGVYTPHASSASAYVEMVVEFSYDATTWIPFTEWTYAAGVRTGTNVVFKIVQTSPKTLLTIDETRGRYFRVKVQETDVTAAFFGTLSLYAYPHAI